MCSEAYEGLALKGGHCHEPDYISSHVTLQHVYILLWLGKLVPQLESHLQYPLLVEPQHQDTSG